MNAHRYRLEPLVRLSERGRRVARRRVASTTRDVEASRRDVRALVARSTAAVALASDAAQSADRTAPMLRALADVRVDSLLATAHAAHAASIAARHRLDATAASRQRRLDECVIAERDAELQRSTRDRAIARVRELERRRNERRETTCALEAWLAANRTVELEDDHAS